MKKAMVVSTILASVLALTGCSNNNSKVTVVPTNVRPTNVKSIMDSTWHLTSFGNSTKFVTTSPSGVVYFGNATGVWHQTKPGSKWALIPKSDSIGPIRQIAFRIQDLVVSSDTGVWLYQNDSWYQLSKLVADSIEVDAGKIYASLPQPPKSSKMNGMNQGPYIPPVYKVEMYQNGKWIQARHRIKKPTSQTDGALDSLPVTSDTIISPRGTLTVEDSPQSGVFENGKRLLAMRDIQKIAWNDQNELAVLTRDAIYIQSGLSWRKTSIPYPGATNEDLVFENDGSLLVIDNEDHPYGTTPSMRETNVWRFQSGKWLLMKEPKTFVANFAVSSNGEIALHVGNQIQWYQNGVWKNYPIGQTEIHGMKFDENNVLTNEDNGLLYKWVNGRWQPYIANEQPLRNTKMYWSIPYFQPNGDLLVYMFQQSGVYDLWLYRNGNWTDLKFHHQISNVQETERDTITVWTDSNATYQYRAT